MSKIDGDPNNQLEPLTSRVRSTEHSEKPTNGCPSPTAFTALERQTYEPASPLPLRSDPHYQLALAMVNRAKEHGRDLELEDYYACRDGAELEPCCAECGGRGLEFGTCPGCNAALCTACGVATYDDDAYQGVMCFTCADAMPASFAEGDIPW